MTTADRPLLLERDREVAALRAAAADAVAGTARLVVVEGPAGIGKSRLLATLRGDAPALGMRVLAARGSDLELEFPFGIVRQLFEPALTDPEVRERWLAGAAAPAAPVLAPPGDAANDPRDASFAALHGLFWLTATAAADAPLLVCVDDLHWADVPSLRYLAYLMRRLEGLPVLLAVGLRSGEPGADPALVAEIAQDQSGVTVRPAPLSGEAAARLVAERLGEDPDEAFIGACHDATGGNPLLLGQLLRSLSDDAVRPDAASAPLVCEIGPRAISRTVLLRLAQLPPDATPTARALAVLGQGADLRGAAALAELDERRASEAIGALARAEILLPDPSLGFVHPVVREAVYRDMDVATREGLHSAAARRLSSAGAAPERVAAHLMHVSPRGDPVVVSVLRAAAASASARGAPETATSLLRRAVAEPPGADARADALVQLGLVESQVDVAAGVQRLREADAALTDGAARLRLARPLAWALTFTGHPQEAAERARAAADSAPPEEDDLRRWLTAIELSTVVFGAEVPDAPARLIAERSTPPGGGPGARALQCYVAFDWCLRGGRVDEVAPLAAGALAGDLLAEPDGFLLCAGALLALEMGERPEADEAWDAAFAQAHRNGSLFAISTILLWRGLGLLWRGDMREARAHLEEAQAMLGRWGILSETHPRIFLTELLVATGAIPGARATLPAQGGWGDRADDSMFRLRAEAGLLLAEGRHAEALETCERLAGALRGRGAAEVMNPAWIPWRSLTARALDGLGRRDEALDLLHAELELARAWGAPGPIGRTLRWIGEMERDDGLPTLEKAVTVLGGSTARHEHALALTALGAALRRARRPTDAREPLRRALELADSCGADALLVERVRSELAAAGARPRTTALSGPGALTPSERRAAAMAAEGMTNRGIAEALYVTPKTVELHLSSAYRKLGVRSRRELPEALAPA